MLSPRGFGQTTLLLLQPLQLACTSVSRPNGNVIFPSCFGPALLSGCILSWLQFTDVFCVCYRRKHSGKKAVKLSWQHTWSWLVTLCSKPPPLEPSTVTGVVICRRSSRWIWILSTRAKPVMTACRSKGQGEIFLPTSSHLSISFVCMGRKRWDEERKQERWETHTHTHTHAERKGGSNPSLRFHCHNQSSTTKYSFLGQLPA